MRKNIWKSFANETGRYVAYGSLAKDFSDSVIEYLKECKLNLSELKKLSEEIVIKTIHTINDK